MIQSINDNYQGKMQEFMIEDMTEDDIENRKYIEKFNAALKKREVHADMIAKRNNLPYYNKIMRAAVWDTYGPEIYLNAFIYFIGEVLGLLYTAHLQYLIKYIKRDDSDAAEAVTVVVIFAALMIFQAIIRNWFIFRGYVTAVRIRKTLVASLFSKITKLTVKSLVQTSSGKLITIVSGDIQAIERPLAMISVIFAAPFANLVGYGIVWYLIDLESAVICFGVWVATLLLQHITTQLSKSFKSKESLSNDERIKMVNDMVVGAKTVKGYGWEKHFEQRICDERGKQEKFVMGQGMLGSLGLSLFQNIGLVVLLAIVIPKWNNGELLEEEVLIPLMAMVFYLFISVNAMAYYSLTTYQQFGAIVERLGHVMGMEEHEFSNTVSQNVKDPKIDLTGANFSWGYEISKTDGASGLVPSKSKSQQKKPIKGHDGFTLNVYNTSKPIL